MALCLAIATRKEYRAVLSPLGAPAVPPDGAATPWRHHGRDMTVLLTGVGPVAAAASLGRLLGSGEVTGVVNLGVAGTFDPVIAPLTSLLAATAETFPEYGLRCEGVMQPRELGFPQLTIAGEPIYDRIALHPDEAAASMRLSLPEHILLGDFATVAGVSADAQASAPDGLTAENMEGFALALACRLAGVPFLELRTISNTVGARPPRGWDLPGALAALARITALLLG